LNVIILDLKESERILKKTVKILGKHTDVVNAGVGCVIVACVEAAKNHKIDCLFTGLGAEEVFAGYHRHTKAKNLHEFCWKGLESMYDQDFVRDYALSKSLKMNFLAPFLDNEVIKLGMQIDGKFKLNDEYKKVILRKAAVQLGMPKEFAWRKKKAAQYGSRIDKAIVKLSKKNGFSSKKKYVLSL